MYKIDKELERRLNCFRMTSQLRIWIRDLTDNFINLPILTAEETRELIQLIEVKHYLTGAEKTAIFFYLQGMDTTFQKGKTTPKMKDTRVIRFPNKIAVVNPTNPLSINSQKGVEL